jgi:hypothetical protein
MEEKTKTTELVNVNLPIPTDNQIAETIQLIEKRLEDKRINMYKNLNVKNGYSQSIEVLKSRKLNYGGVESIQGRAIVAIAFDYLNGQCSQEVLINVPLKSQF